LINISIPIGAQEIINALENSGHEAYIVGGCVRDSIMGKKPNDWDICTSAVPEQIKESLQNFRIIETGIKHGTVTVLADDDSYEVTTYRVDGVYTDNRRPDKVEFIKDLTEDLKRRDFTINAMAYNPKSGLADPFGGLSSIENKIISCVGEPRDRFNEDGLRIMRAMRFSSTLSFDIDKRTSEMIHYTKGLLWNIAAERINSELCKLLLGKNSLDILLEYKDVIKTIIPEFGACIGFDQNTKYHNYTVYEHTARAVSAYKGNDIAVKLVLLFHDIGKPLCYTADENGGHFYGHAARSLPLARAIMQRLRFDTLTINEVEKLIIYHDSKILATYPFIKRSLNKIGLTSFKRLLEVKMADDNAKSKEYYDAKYQEYIEVNRILEDIVASESCYSLKSLAVNGDDILSLGVPQGKMVGEILSDLLESVINGNVENKKHLLLDRAKLLINEKI